MDFLILVVKGFIIGIAKVIPGVSGAVLMITLGLYEKCLFAITHFWKNVKEHFRLLMGIGIGVVIAIVLGSKIIAFLLESYKLQIVLLFLGLIIGGLPSFTKRVRKYPCHISQILIFICCFTSVCLLSFFNFHLEIANYKTLSLLFLLIGFIDAATMIIPGISGTAILMLLGLYEMAITLFASLDSIASIFAHLAELLPYAFGLGVGILIVSFAMDYLFRKHAGSTYYGILGFQCSAILVLLLELLQFGYSFIQLIIGMIFMIFGIYIAALLEKWS